MANFTIKANIQGMHFLHVTGQSVVKYNECEFNDNIIYTEDNARHFI